MKIRVIGAVVVLGMALTACSGGNDDAKAADAISAGMMKDAGTELSLDQDQADCVGDGMVEKVGTEKLVEYGILTEDMEYGKLEPGGVKMSDEDAEGSADVIMDCVGSGFVTDALETQAEMLPEAARECIEENLTDDVMRDMLKATFTGDDSAAAEVMGPLMKCAMQVPPSPSAVNPTP